MEFDRILQAILIYAPSVVFAITLHEAAHGYVAKHFGDTTAYMLGRVSLNPAKHIDPIGTVVLPIVTLAIGNFLFGWAKPVPVNFNNLRRPKQDMLWVAFAGPASNLVQVAIWATLARTLSAFATGQAGSYWIQVAVAGIDVNMMFALLNLLPVLPLDGGRILMSLLPNPLAYRYSRLEPYGLVILLVLMFTGALGWILGPLLEIAMAATYSLFGLR